MQPRNRNAWLWTISLVVATILHVFMWYQRAPIDLTGNEEIAKKTDEIVIDRVPGPADREERQVVQTSKAQEDKDLKDKKARFGGEFKNRVAKETQSPNQGSFKQGGPNMSGAEVESDRGEPGGPMMHELMPFSSSPHGLPNDIERGAETMLNTDPVLYASFINRIADEIYDAWVVYAKQAVRLYMSKRNLETNVYITKLEVEINKSGEVTGITILKHSGVDALDRAPERAFWDAKNFPNPPVQMFGANDLMKFEYEFHFEWKTGSFGISPLNI